MTTKKNNDNIEAAAEYMKETYLQKKWRSCVFRTSFAILLPCYLPEPGEQKKSYVVGFHCQIA
jgi:hypothetical protein